MPNKGAVRRGASRTGAVAVAAAAVIGLTATAALADYQLNGNVTSRTYRGSSGVSGVYKSYSYSVAGNPQVCVRASSLSSNDPLDANNFSRIWVVTGTTQTPGGYGSIAVGNRVRMNVNTDASPSQCAGYKLAYQVWVYK